MAIDVIIEDKLLLAFAPLYLDVVNEEPVISRSEQQPHFKVIIISSVFEGLRINQRHKLINAVLANELTETISGLALHAFTESEWQGGIADTMPLSAYYLSAQKIA